MCKIYTLLYIYIIYTLLCYIMQNIKNIKKEL